MAHAQIDALAMRLSNATRLTLVALLIASLTVPMLRAAPRRVSLEEAQARLLALEKDFELVVEEYNLVHERAVALQARIARAELAVRHLRPRMAVGRAAAVDLARELYKVGPAVALEAVLTAQTVADIEVRLKYLNTTQSAQARVFERLSADEEELQQRIAVLEDARAEAVAAESRLTDLRRDIEAKLVEQRDEIAHLNAAIERAQRRREAAGRARALEAARRAAASAVAVPAPAATAAPRAAVATNPAAQRAVDAALSQVGKPYQWGGAGPDSYDCSGLTMWAWGHAGVSLPHNSGAQYDATARVSQEGWQPGDLLFFGSPIHHVAMYIGDGEMVEAPYSGQYVRVVSAYRSDYVGAGRPGV